MGSRISVLDFKFNLPGKSSEATDILVVLSDLILPLFFCVRSRRPTNDIVYITTPPLHP
jgi:hypothetical protein